MPSLFIIPEASLTLCPQRCPFIHLFTSSFTHSTLLFFPSPSSTLFFTPSFQLTHKKPLKINNNTMAPKHKKSKTSGGAPPAPAQGGAKATNKSAKAKAIAEARAKADVAPITHISQNRRGHHGGFAKFDNKDQSEKLKPKEKTEVELENLIFGADNQELVGEAFSRIGHELSSDEEDAGDDGFDYDLEVGFGDDEEGGEGGDMFFMDAGPTPVMREEIDEDAEDMEEPVDEEIGAGEDVEEEGASEDEEVSRLKGELLLLYTPRRLILKKSRKKQIIETNPML